MLHDQTGAGVLDDGFDPAHGGQRVGTIRVVNRDALELSIGAQMIEIAGENDGAAFRQLEFQRLDLSYKSQHTTRLIKSFYSLKVAVFDIR